MQSSAKKLHRVLSAAEIRKTFIDYFTVHHQHKFVRSSPVVPFSDATVAFVNAGMNQFKSIFLGKSQPKYVRVANSQKCVRVGGKHNDLCVVGQDGYHHTFFEMLGNWSFGDYFKREACEMALDLLRGPYNIDPARLYFTYFAGDKVLGLPADLECYEIWRSLGISKERILPFGCTDNFWEMGNTGPCGPCTEIHIDHRPDLGNIRERAKLVNAGRADLTELWNLVFMQYNRNEDGSITPLPAHHVDTGMGFERLTAILQNKSSNYDTDLFAPLFHAIQKISKAPHYSGTFPTLDDMAQLDTGYRVLTDHARMVTVCLADGMLPDQNQKLRRVLRKAFSVSEHVFANEQLLQQLVPIVLETLSTAYPEMCAKQQAIQELINHELEVFKSLRSSSSKAFAEVLAEFPHLEDLDLMECPGFVPAFREFQAQKHTFTDNMLPGKFLFKLSDTYGLSEENFKQFAELEQMQCNLDEYRAELQNAKLRSKAGNKSISNDARQLLLRIDEVLSQLTKQLPNTDNSHKYNYQYVDSQKQYDIPAVNTRILGLLLNELPVNEITLNNLQANENSIYVITEASNFYYESGGQQSDIGKLQFSCCIDLKATTIELNVVSVKCINDCIVHVCQLPAETAALANFKIQLGDEVHLLVNAERRTLNTLHHTVTHLLNAAIRSLFNKVTYQVSSTVSSDQCKLEVGLINKRITKEDVELIENFIGRAICAAAPVQVQMINAADVLQQNDITMVPGEVYPENGLRLININCESLKLQSKELCCGTHATNTQEIEYFCITNLKLTNRARYAFSCVAGTIAEQVLKTAALIQHRVDVLEQQYKSDKLTNATGTELQKIRNNILHTDLILPYAFKRNTLERINDILRKLKETTRTTLREFVEVEMKNLLQEKPLESHPYLVHYIRSSALMEEVPLQNATVICTDRPILVIAKCDNIVKARCCVPKKFINENFTAEIWLKEFAAVFKTAVTPVKGQNAAEVCNMKGKRVSTHFEEQLETAIDKANEFASKHLL